MKYLGLQEIRLANGIVFLDEIDKVVGNNGGSGPDVSREGVQRDLLPIVEEAMLIQSMVWYLLTIFYLLLQELFM